VKPSSKFIVDCSAPVADQIFDMAAFEKYLVDRVKVNGRTNNLTEGGVTIARDGDKLVFQSTDVAVAKRYLKYLTKKFLKKQQLRDWLRVISTDKQTYVVKYFKVGDDGEESEDEQ
jgi:large subunit ribosomal protein L22e